MLNPILLCQGLKVLVWSIPDLTLLLQSKVAAERAKKAKALQTMTSGEIMVSMDPAVLQQKLLNPPHESRRQQTVDALKLVQTAQDDPHYGNLVSLVGFCTSSFI